MNIAYLIHEAERTRTATERRDEAIRNGELGMALSHLLHAHLLHAHRPHARLLPARLLPARSLRGWRHASARSHRSHRPARPALTLVTQATASPGERGVAPCACSAQDCCPAC